MGGRLGGNGFESEAESENQKQNQNQKNQNQNQKNQNQNHKNQNQNSKNQNQNPKIKSEPEKSKSKSEKSESKSKNRIRIRKKQNHTNLNRNLQDLNLNLKNLNLNLIFKVFIFMFTNEFQSSIQKRMPIAMLFYQFQCCSDLELYIRAHTMREVIHTCRCTNFNLLLGCLMLESISSLFANSNKSSDQ